MFQPHVPHFSLLDVTDRQGLNRFEYHPDPTIEYNHEIMEYEEGKELSIKVRSINAMSFKFGKQHV